MPISTWNYKAQRNTPISHLGPVAQDFYAAFPLGADDKHINDIDEAGVALAAIKGLNEKVEAQKAELKVKDDAIQSLEQRLEHLEKLVSTMPSQP
jgi:hypothetical protein